MRDQGRDVPPELLESTLAAFDGPFFICGTDGTLVHWNEAVPATTGLSGDALASTTPAGLVADEDADRVETAIADAHESGRATVTALVVTGDGDRVPHELRFVHSGEYVSCLAWGVGEKVGAESTPRPFLDRMTDAFFAVDDDWRLTYVNEQAGPILAAAMGETDGDADLVGRHLWDAVPEAVDTPFYECYQTAMERQESRTITEYYEPLDTYFEVRAYPSETGLSVYFRDVTDQQRQQRRLREREEVLRETYRITSDTDRSFEQQVSALLEMGTDVLGTEYGTLSRIRDDEYVFEVVHAPDDSVTAGDTIPLSATSCERVATTEETLVVGDMAVDAPSLASRAGNEQLGLKCYLGAPVVVGQEVYGTFCFYGTRTREGGFSEWETTLVDLMSQWVGYELTSRRTRERLERQNERLERFASIVSHDLRNPLEVVGSALRLAEETGDRAHFQRGLRAVDRMEALVDDLLTMARAGEELTDRQPVALSAVAADAWGTVETPASSLEVETDLTVSADPSRLRQLFENVFGNAVEHAADGQGVSVTVGRLDDGFYIDDDGPGIPESEREAVFEAGYTTSDDGTGFGLNIVREVTHAHGWQVGIAGSPAGGTRIEVTDVET